MKWFEPVDPKSPRFDLPLNLMETVRGDPVVRFEVSLQEKNSLVILPLWKGPLAPRDWQCAVYDERVHHSHVGLPYTEYFNQAVTFDEVIVVRPVKKRVVLRIRRRGYIPFELDIRLSKGKRWVGTLYWDLAYNGPREP